MHITIVGFFILYLHSTDWSYWLLEMIGRSRLEFHITWSKYLGWLRLDYLNILLELNVLEFEFNRLLELGNLEFNFSSRYFNLVCISIKVWKHWRLPDRLLSPPYWKWGLLEKFVCNKQIINGSNLNSYFKFSKLAF